MPEPTPVRRYRSPVRGLRLINLRSFQDTGRLRISPINFIFGKNSSGKTTIIRSLLFYKQLVAETSLSGEVPFVGPYADFGSYKESVYNGEKSRDISLTVAIPITRREMLPARYKDSLPDISSLRIMEVTVQLHWNARLGRAQYNSIEFRDATTLSEATDPSGRVLLCLTRTSPNKFKVSIPDTSWSGLIESENELNFSSLSWGFNFANTRNSVDREPPREVEVYSYELFRELRQAIVRVEHVGPLRDMPERAYRLAEAVIPSGSTQHVLGLLEKNENAIRDISDAMNELRVARQVQLARPAPGYAGIVVKDIRTGRSDNLADVGFGVSQVLPIIARVATARPGALILIEQPELHLHPETQGRLVDVLLDLAAKKRVTLFIESHSEAMLLRLRRRVAEGVASNRDVCIYVTDEGNVRRADLGADGRLDVSAFPTDFFEEDWIDAVAMAKLAAPDR